MALHHRYLVGERGATALQLLPTFVGDGDDLRPNPDAARLDRRTGRGAPAARRRVRSRLCAPRDRVELGRAAAETGSAPRDRASSSAGPAATQAVDLARAAGVRLTTRDERHQIRRIADAHLGDLADADLVVLGLPTPGSTASRRASPPTTPAWCPR